ncbi:MAG: hypothetical protein RBG13Loki_1553 [Promethearchaeota archaeon CR_4]|nr:MAG: hypothetical protein RBG13Loki_1553 [Candidatus Lokiarchaeota archaeon CR_4]
MKNFFIQARNQEQLLRARDKQGLRVVVGQNPFEAPPITVESKSNSLVFINEDKEKNQMMVWCPACNAMQKQGIKYCTKCGIRMP